MRHIISTIRGAICQICCRDSGSRGTGFLVSSDGVCLTSAHVVCRPVPDARGYVTFEYSTDIAAITVQGQKPARVIHRQNTTHPIVEDYAVLRVDIAGVPYLPLGDYASAEAGDDVLIAGFPLGADFLSFSRGIVAAKVRVPSHINTVVSLNILQLDASVNPGNSGGPLFHLDTGSVVGIVAVRLGNIEEHIERLSRLPQTRGDLPLTEIVDTLRTINAFMNPGIGRAISIEYANEELRRLNLV